MLNTFTSGRKVLLLIFAFYLLLQRAPIPTDAAVTPTPIPSSDIETPSSNVETDMNAQAMENAAEVTETMSGDKAAVEQVEMTTETDANEPPAKACRKEKDCQKTDWWKHMVIYQIYPRSFMDSNGDGVGDLQGIISKLSYVADMGIKAIWLSPICKSPMSDFGYDVSDFKAIHNEYGTMEDFDMMMTEANRLGLKLILDLVPNHTSNQSMWFEKSVNRETDYEDFYVWAAAKTNEDGERMPPNNWRSVFYGPAWTYNEQRGQYYYHQFTPDQPDLNFRNPKVIAAMDEVMHFWLDKGIHGFRIDAVNHIYEDEKLRDEPPSGETQDESNYEYLKHIYTKDLPEVLDIVQHWRQIVDDYTAKHGGDTRIIMTEAYTDVKILMNYYETKDGKQGAHFPFNFNFINKLDVNSDARDYVYLIQKWLTYMPRGHVANWIMGNHDNSRMATHFGPKLVDAMHMLMMTLPGVAVTYNGEEIGMQDHKDISWEETVDPFGLKAGRELYKSSSRDAVRTPFHWNTQKNAGFSSAEKTWLPVHPSYSHLNLKQQMAEKSHYSVYKDLVALRSRPALRKGRFHAEVLNRDVFAFQREMKDENSIITVINIGPRARAVNLTEAFDLNKQQKLTVLISGVKSTHEMGNALPADALSLAPYEGLVCMLE